jgi:hypothetical protein
MMNRGCCNECGYKADYITDYNNYESKGYKNFDEVPEDKMLCGACWEIKSGYKAEMDRDITDIEFEEKNDE